MELRHYTTAGLDVGALVRDGAGPAVVLLHGAGGNALAWLPLLPGFAGRRLILVDLPGHGESPPVADWSLDPLAERLATAIGPVAGGAAVWGGHSWGGKLAAIVCGRFPAQARALVLVDPSPASPVPIVAEEFVDEALAPEIGPWPSLEAAVSDIRRLPQYATWNDDVRQAFERGLETRPDGTVAGRVRREWLVEITRATLLRDHSARIARVRCPTLLAVADRSLHWQQPTNLALLENLPNVETVTLAGHHWLHWAAPDRLSRRISAWLDAVLS